MNARIVSLHCALAAFALALLQCQSPPAESQPVALSAEQTGPAYLGIIYVSNRGTAGVRVVDVLPASPAERAGILKGDTIVYANGQFIGGGYLLRAIIDALRPGQTIDLALRRLNGHETRVTAELDPIPPGDPWMRQRPQ
ncbi:MAG: PDZ domain-containing protein [Leptospirales bacterium]|nr:PDZ domain-containing protein [Leptospirales bacterium]